VIDLINRGIITEAERRDVRKMLDGKRIEIMLEETPK
jgi:hypothetical protein